MGILFGRGAGAATTASVQARNGQLPARPPAATTTSAPASISPKLPALPLEGPVTPDMIGDGVWWRPELNEAAIEKVMSDLDRWNVRNLYIETFRSGETIYRSSVFPAMQNDGKDWLAITCAAGRRHGVRVHAWIHTLFWRQGVNNAASHPLLSKHSEWIEQPKMGEPRRGSEAEYVFVSPGDPGVRKTLMFLLEELCERDIAGINLDYIRYPANGPDFGYSAGSLERFRKAAGLDGTGLARDLNPGSPWMKWVEFRENQVTELVGLLASHGKANGKAKGTRILISSAYFPGYAAERGKNHKFQNWMDWVRRGYLDISTPMCYATNLAGLAKEFEEVKAEHRGMNVACIPGLALGTFSSPHPPLTEQKPVLERAGYRHFVAFKYETLKDEMGNN